ncbi:ChuX/HutX family heme-like substrate-binding protein, partial [Psychrobacter celer]
MSQPLSLITKNTELWQQYQALKEKTPMLFPTEGAAALGVSEFELMLASPYSQYIGDKCKTVLQQFARFGSVESIVRNDLAVHEKTA